jgi:GT2 family glycosyltransferase
MQHSYAPAQISVVVPAYNVAPYIGEALASLQAQTFGAFEAIVIDDGSTDATVDAIAPFLGDSRFRLIRTANAGLSAARNVGIADVRAPFVAMLDSDDRYRPAYLEKMLARISAEPDLAFVTCDAESFVAGNDHRERFSDRYAQGEPITLETLLTDRTKIFGLCTLRTDALRKVGGYDPALRAAEDLDLWLRLLGTGHAGGLVPEVLVDYRRRTGSLSDDRARLMTAAARALDKAVTALGNRPEAALAEVKRDAAQAIALFETGVDLALTGEARRGIGLMRTSRLKDGNAKWQALLQIFSLLPPLAPPALTLYRRGNQFA